MTDGKYKKDLDKRYWVIEYPNGYLHTGGRSGPSSPKLYHSPKVAAVQLTRCPGGSRVRGVVLLEDPPSND